MPAQGSVKGMSDGSVETGYTRRVLDGELDDLLPGLAAVALEGPKGVGKTETALRRAASVFMLDSVARRQVLEADPDAVLHGFPPVLVDEWQRVPEVWDTVRRRVDRDRTPGQFLLTGSATPAAGSDPHSGAGRIVSLRMRPMALCERGLVDPTVSLARLMAGTADIGGDSPVRLPDYVEEIVASGFPGIRSLPPRARRAQLDGYLRRIVDRDFPEQLRLVRRPAVLRGWLAAYAAATATTTAYTRLLDSATPGETDKPAKTTTIAYRDLLTRLWLLDPVPGWAPTPNLSVRLQQAPKHQLADPALAARLLGVDVTSLLGGTPGAAGGSGDGALLGRLFESLATLTVNVAAQAAECGVAHLRTRNGDHEVDLVVTGPAGRVLGIEVKLSAGVGDDDVRHLHWLRHLLGGDLADAVVLTTGPTAYRRRDGIAVLPLALLGA